MGLNGSAELHWLSPIGLIYRDDRTDEELAALQASAIESIFCSSQALSEIAGLQAEILDGDAPEMTNAANTAVPAVLDRELKEILAARRAEKTARKRRLGGLPDWRQIKETRGEKLEIEADTTFEEELGKLNTALETNDLDRTVK